ncbi:MAG TPA: hypothetical protein VFG09_11145 [Thermodesulfovibrionales bacterium]|jgi:hypothetical protein|nr:hypothetical protein [Thermodesulfovibrionales bacterium]
MNGDPSAETLMAALRCGSLLISNRALLKSLTLGVYVLFLTAVFMSQPFSVQAGDGLSRNASPDEVIAQLKGRLNLSAEQEARIRPIIEDNLAKRGEILKSDTQDRQAIKMELQKLRWTTDIKLSKILTEEQMKEYEKFMEEQHDKASSDQRQGKSRGSRGGGLRGF